MGMVPLLTAIAEDEYDAEELAEDLKRSEGECVVEEREPNGESAVALDNRRRLAMSFGCLERRLKAVRKRMDEALAPRRTYMLEYLNPLLDEAGRPCGSEDEHDQLLDQMLDEVSAWEHVLGWLTGATDLNEHELEFARTQFYEPLIATTKKAANENGWKFISASRDEHRRGFCSRISWYHKFAASRERQGMIPGERLVSTGTLHPNTYGQYYAAMRALIATSFDQAFADHNVFCIRSAKMAAAEKGKPNPDGTYGFAWYIWNKDKANEKGRLAANYHAFLVDSTCKASRFKPNLQP
jgi:hypothetical protein